jgi:translation initiation factor 2 subunit 2
MMRRSPEHVFQFMMAELGTEGSIDGNQRLVIRGKFVPKVNCCQSLEVFIIILFRLLTFCLTPTPCSTSSLC